MSDFLEFEKPLLELQEKIQKLRNYSGKSPSGLIEEIKKLEQKAIEVQKEIYVKLTPWQKNQIARHPKRPHLSDYLPILFPDFIELHGDRLYYDDHSIIGGMAHFSGRSVFVIGHAKGRSMKEKVKRNFGMPHPEGYRKALRLMRLAEKFQKPVLTFIDTPGAYPGLEAEARGVSEAIARNLMVMSRLRVPIISVVIGEGGSGGALALAVSDRILMFEHSTYSVISPEGCAAIIWKDRNKSEAAANSLRITAKDLMELGMIDTIIPEPPGGAHRDWDQASQSLSMAIQTHLNTLEKMPIDLLLQERYEKFKKMGVFGES